MLYTRVPITSDGSKSGVNWILLKLPLIVLERVFIANVLATPGNTSSNTWPEPNKPISNYSWS